MRFLDSIIAVKTAKKPIKRTSVYVVSTLDNVASLIIKMKAFTCCTYYVCWLLILKIRYNVFWWEHAAARRMIHIQLEHLAVERFIIRLQNVWIDYTGSKLTTGIDHCSLYNAMIRSRITSQFLGLSIPFTPILYNS